MFAIVRRVAFSLPSLIVAGLAAAYLLFAWLGFEPLTRWLAPKIVADKSAHRLTIERARFDPFRLTVQLGGVKLTEPGGKPLLAFEELLVDFQLASVFKRAYTFKEVRLSEPDVRIEIDNGGHLNWMRLVEAFAGAPGAKSEGEGGLPPLLIEHAVLQKGRVDLEDLRLGGGFRTAAEPLDLELNDLSTLPEDKGDHVVSVRTSFGAQVRWNGELGLNPLVAHGDVVVDDLQLARIWPYLRRPLQIAPPEGLVKVAFAYRVGHEQGRLAAHVEQMAIDLQALTLRGLNDSDATLMLDRVALTGGRFDVMQRTGSLDTIEINGGRIALERSADGRLNVQQWLPPAGDAGAAAPAPASAAPSDAIWRFAVGRVALDGVSCRVVDQTFAAPLAVDVGRVQAGFKADVEILPSGSKVKVDDVAVNVSSLRLGLAAQKSPLLELDQITLQGGQIDLAGQTAMLGKVALHGARMGLTRDARGELSLQSALRTAKATPAAAPSDAPAAATPWRYRIDSIEADGVLLALRDESVQPSLALTLHHIEAEARGLSDDAKAAMPVRLRLQVKEGGRFEAHGSVVRAAPSADLRVKLDDLSLAPAQPLIAQAAHLVLAGGRVSSAGRVRMQGSKVRYDGAFAVKDLLLNEADSDERFLAWKSLGTNRLAVTTQALEIDELRVVGLGAKLLIAKDRSINVGRIIKKRAAADEAAPAKAEPVAARPAAPPPYGIKIGRVRVSEGDVDFADLSLALPFGARIHDLKGEMVGLSNQPGGTAQLEFQGRVDEYGLSRAAGQINLFDPTAFTDIHVIFQNVEMTRLTPYSATFAGRKIASGKLSLDLEYKVKERQLQGQNQVVMDELTLGERVDSPGASNLPLDLALAILQDQNGKIDLGLPVSGSLDDPQFSYGGIIWKAIVNVLTKVVTAPFRALGALFGGGDEQTAKVTFDAGEADLLPPEREKLKKLAEAIAKRPRLSLAVQAAFDPGADRDALKAANLRRTLAAQMGRELKPGDEAGPVSTSDPQARAAIEALYVKRFGAPALQSMQAKFAQANPAPPPADAAGRLVSRVANLFKGTPPPLSADESAELKGAELHAVLHDRLLDAETVSDEQLRALGASRAEAISRELVADGVATDRIQLAAPSARDVSATISLGAMPSAPAASAPTAAMPAARGSVARAQ